MQQYKCGYKYYIPFLQIDPPKSSTLGLKKTCFVKVNEERKTRLLDLKRTAAV